ncbi:hypothetical protein FACS1894142_5670 [Spirochaetia bacterium]|nr:hypothetical protein FACS1894142_5670 [Spirochaetia bacterium]
MKIDTLMKDVFEAEIEQNRSRIPPVSGDASLLLRAAPPQNGLGTRLRTGAALAACFAFVIFISVLSLKTDVLRSPLVYQGEAIAKLIPENPAEALYDFFYAINSSL